MPSSYAIALCHWGAGNFVIAAPSGTAPTLDGITAPGVAAGMFSHDLGVHWPNMAGVRAARAYLANGWPIVLAFPIKAVAVACHARLVQDQAK